MTFGDPLSPEAQAYGERTADKLMVAVDATGRMFTKAELAALCAVAYAAGQRGE
ncbi:MAG: hypothetical protein ACJ8DZ_13940 [Allosphingosinicella sp.]